MSMLSSFTGIGLNPFGKRKIKINPARALATGLTVASMGGYGPLAGIGSKIGSVASHLPGAAKIGGVLSAGKRLLGKMPQQPGTSGDGGGMSGFGLGDILRGAGGFAKEHAGDLAIGGLAAAQAANAARASKRQGQLSDKALALANERWQSQAPLRTAGMTGLLKPRPPVDYGAVYADPTNPFAGAGPRKIGTNAPPQAMPQVMPQPMVRDVQGVRSTPLTLPRQRKLPLRTVGRI